MENFIKQATFFRLEAAVANTLALSFDVYVTPRQSNILFGTFICFLILYKDSPGERLFCFEIIYDVTEIPYNTWTNTGKQSARDGRRFCQGGWVVKNIRLWSAMVARRFLKKSYVRRNTLRVRLAQRLTIYTRLSYKRPKSVQAMWTSKPLRPLHKTEIVTVLGG